MRVTFLFFALFISSVVYGQLPLIDDIPFEPENYSPDFDEINDIVSKEYSFLGNKKINIDSLYGNYKKKIAAAENKEEYFRYLLMYFSELRNSHTTLYLGEYGVNCSAELIEKRVFFTRVDDDLFIQTGIQSKNEILEIDDIPVFQWLNEQKQYVSASTPDHELNNALWKIFNSEFKTARTYRIQTRTGIKTLPVKLEVPVDYSLLFSSDKANASGKMLNKHTGYISINSMTGSVVQDFIKAYDLLSEKTNLIIDLRENTGGNSNLSEQIARFLISEPQRACVSRKKMKPYPNHYQGKLYVLVGLKTASAAESLAIDLRESGTAILIGSPTAGDTGNGPRNFRTSYGTSFRIPTRKPQVSFKNFPMEGIGVPPHYKVYQTVTDYHKGTDSVLMYTLREIEKTEEH